LELWVGFGWTNIRKCCTIFLEFLEGGLVNLIKFLMILDSEVRGQITLSFWMSYNLVNVTKRKNEKGNHSKNKE